MSSFSWLGSVPLLFVLVWFGCCYLFLLVAGRSRSGLYIKVTESLLSSYVRVGGIGLHIFGLGIWESRAKRASKHGSENGLPIFD